MILPDPDAFYDGTEWQGERMASFAHLKPRSLNGAGGSNLVIAHRGCNSKRGSQKPTPHEERQLHDLNQRRVGIVSERGFHRKTFCEPTPASDFLLDSIEKLDGGDGAKVRKSVFRHMNRAIVAIGAFRDIKSLGHWTLATDLLKVEFRNRGTKLPDPFATCCDNIITTVIARERDTRLATHRPRRLIEADIRMQRKASQKLAQGQSEEARPT
jgi:hypothetical protein